MVRSKRGRTGLSCAGLMAAALLWACSSGNSGGNEPTPSDPDPFEPSCFEGATCSCPLIGQNGTVTCEGGYQCQCEPCDALQVTAAPTVSGCGGEPFGTWRLSEAKWGVSKLTISLFDEPLGDCPLMVTSEVAETPHVLMRLYEGGAAEYFSEQAPLRMSYSESCVTSKASSLSCGSDRWTGVTDCSVDCDICSCSAYAEGVDIYDGTWLRTEEALSLGIFEGGSYAYCVEANQLQVSKEGMHFVFERVTELVRPVPCAERTPEQCTVGKNNTCQLGACVGSDDCEAAPSEGQCLTIGGCTWNADQCSGLAEDDCALSDFGTLPGCELTNQQVSCQGTAAACDGRTAQQCVAGCAVNPEGRCAGGPLDCAKFSFCPPTECEPQSDLSCAGQTTCEVQGHGTESSCNNVGDAYGYDGVACHWEAVVCEGTATSCTDVPTEECNRVPGCSLVVVP